MNEKKRFWQTEVGRIVLLTVAVLLAGVAYDAYWRSNWGPWFSNEDAIQWSKETNEQMDCMAEILSIFDHAALETLSDAERIFWGTEIRQRCENIDCVAQADTDSRQVYGTPLDEWGELTRARVLVEHCWRRGIPGYWRRLANRD